MRKYTIIALALMLTMALSACRGSTENPTTNSTDSVMPSTTQATVMPTLPTMETNIPDPSVDTGHLGDGDSTVGTDGMMGPNGSTGTDGSGNTGGTNSKSHRP